VVDARQAQIYIPPFEQDVFGQFDTIGWRAAAFIRLYALKDTNRIEAQGLFQGDGMALPRLRAVRCHYPNLTKGLSNLHQCPNAWGIDPIIVGY
jgi:hypothetical protein